MANYEDILKSATQGMRGLEEYRKILAEDLQSSMSVPDFGQSELIPQAQRAVNQQAYYEAQVQRNYEHHKAQEEINRAQAQIAQDLQDAFNGLGAATYTTSASAGTSLTQSDFEKMVRGVWNEGGQRHPVHDKTRSVLTRWLRASKTKEFSLRWEKLSTVL